MVAYHEDGGSSIRRMLAHRGVDHVFIISRTASDEENANESHPYRLGFIPYDDWDKLIEDEKKYTSDEVYLCVLQQLKTQYPQFNHSVNA